MMADRTYLDDWDRRNPMDTERRLKELLHGKRLVGELDLTPEENVFQMSRWVFNGVTSYGDYPRLRSFPAVTVVFLVGEGGRGYDEGTFWPNIESLQEASSKDRATVGRMFERSVCRLGLEDFSGVPESDHWLRYVTPILLHGGIPASCAQDAAELILFSLRKGLRDSAELIDSVLHSSARNTQFAKPLRRFFDFGGEFALDLVQRMIQVVFDVGAVGLDIAEESVDELADDFSLPKYLVQALIDVQSLSDGSSFRKAVRNRRAPRPQIRIDRYSCNGPYLVLPPVESGGEWLVTGSSASRYKVLRRDSREVPLVPARGWNVTRRSEDAVESRVRFEGHPGGVSAYVFDVDGRLAREQRQLKGSEALILAAKGVEAVCDDGTPVPLAEEMPDRSESWQHWTLLGLDISEVTAVTLRVSGPDREEEVRLPVSRPIPSPAITSIPVRGVTGPDGCLVYAEAPLIEEPEGTEISVWRGRWRSDDETSPPSTWMLKDLPNCSQGRDIVSRLPDQAAFCGTVEITGPLGSDLRERVAVVRGLRVQLPDRIIGPNETVEAALSADCVLTCSDGSSGRAVTVVLYSGCDSVEIAADGMPLTVTIPRLSWAINRRNRSLPEFGGDRERIGLDEIESGEAETLMVRCGRPASVSLELRGSGTLQQAEPVHEAEPVHAAGEQGRWAFSLPQFRDTVSASGLTRMVLTLQADDVKVEAADIVALYEVSELEVVVSDIEECEALLDVQWRENRPFKSRQLRLWSQHRLWESPVCVEIPDDVDGRFDDVVPAPPGLYLVEIVVRDDWVTPQRPSLDRDYPGTVRIGTRRDEEVRFSKLKPTIATEALELVVAGHLSGTRIDSHCVISAREELVQAFRVSCCSTVLDTTVVDNLIQFALTVDGLLVEMFVEDLVGLLPRNALLRLTLTLVASAGCYTVDAETCAADPETLEILWETVPVAAALFDRKFDDDSVDRWVRFTGWDPTYDFDGLRQPSEPISEPFDRFEPYRITELSDVLPLKDSLHLQLGGYMIAALELLEKAWPGPDRARTQLNNWMSAHTRIITYTQRLSPVQLQQIDALSPASRTPGWYKFPARLLTVAFQLTDEYASSKDRDDAVRALLEAAEIAPLLTTRSLLIAMALRAASAY